MLEIVISDSDSMSLLHELEEVLLHGKLAGLARLPEPRPSERYRDILVKLYRNVGLCQAVVWVEKAEGNKFAYVFILKALAKGGEACWSDAPMQVEGYKVEFIDKRVRKIEYRPASFKRAAEALKRIEEVAEKYQKAETALSLERALSFDPYTWS
jgi:hypothetical protein